MVKYKLKTKLSEDSYAHWAKSISPYSNHRSDKYWVYDQNRSAFNRPSAVTIRIILKYTMENYHSIADIVRQTYDEFKHEKLIDENVEQ